MTRKVSLIAILLSFGLSSINAEEVLRGDANGDGEVSISDVQVILNHHFRELTSPCVDAFDVNDDGVSWANDAWDLAFYLLGSGDPPSEPFPSRGEAADPACESFNPIPPLEDEIAAVNLLDISMESSGKAFIQIEIQHSTSLGSFHFKIEDPGQILRVSEGDEISPLDYSGLLDMKFIRSSEGDLLVVGVVGALYEQFLPASPDPQLILEIPVCIESGVELGTYPLRITDAEFSDFETGASIYPQTRDGFVEVEHTVPTFCYPVLPKQVTYELEGASASPGEDITIAFKVRSTTAFQILWFGIDFDEDFLEVTGFDRVYERPDGQAFEIEAVDFYNERETLGLVPPDAVVESALGGVFMISDPFQTQVRFPISEEFTLANIHFRVKDTAPMGTQTEIKFKSGVPARSRPLNRVCTPDVRGCVQLYEWKNEISAGIQRLNIETADSFVTLPGVLKIIADQSFFIRGDSNRDFQVDLSDAIHVLSGLFTGEYLRCPDASDANDDSKIDLTDAIVILENLFLEGSRAFPQPFPAAGEDPTTDDLRCAEGREGVTEGKSRF